MSAITSHALFPPPQGSCLDAFRPRLALPAKARWSVLPQAEGRTCDRLGFNLEVQEHHDATNLWDHLADSGATVLRKFHPEIYLRRRPAQAGDWGAIASRAEFDALRARVVADPQRGGVRWADYRFDEAIPWLGVPDAILARVRDLGIEALVPLGYAPRMFPRPLIRDPACTGIPADGQLDWEAMASAWEYCFALAFHFAGRAGIRRFMMINEPEWRNGSFFLPPEVEALGPDWFDAFFVTYRHEDLRQRFFAALAQQCGVLARCARLALDDAAQALGCERLALLGPAASNWEAYWPHVAPWVDVADYHHYSVEGDALRARHARLAQAAAPRRLGLGEVNRIAGEMEPQDSYFVLDRALDFAGMLIDLLRLRTAAGDPLAYACIYLFAFPSTHRNYKALVYGDMNLVDWTGCDLRLHASPEHHPTQDEQQLRHPTHAYHCFRMLARCAGHEELTAPLTLRDSAQAPHLYRHLRSLVVRQPGRILLNLLYQGREVLDPITVDLTPLGGAVPRWAVIRHTTAGAADAVVGEVEVTAGALTLTVPPRSLVQVILSDLDPSTIGAARIEVLPSTSGRLDDLRLWQTLRLRCRALVTGTEHDLTDHDVVWRSEHPALVRVGSGGLVQRRRATSRPVRIQAGLCDGRVLAEVVVPPWEP